MKEVSLAATEGQTPQPTPPRGGRINLFGGLVVVILLVGALFVSGLGGALDSVPSLHTLAAGTVSLDSAAPEVAACGEGAWSLLLVNRDSPLPDGYQVELTHLSNGQSVDKRIYPALQAMFDAARARRLTLSWPRASGPPRSSRACWMKKSPPLEPRGTPPPRPGRTPRLGGLAGHQRASDRPGRGHQRRRHPLCRPGSIPLAGPERLPVRVHSPLPLRQDRDHRYLQRALALPLRRGHRRRGDPPSKPLPGGIPEPAYTAVIPLFRWQDALPTRRPLGLCRTGQKTFPCRRKKRAVYFSVYSPF